MTDHERMNRKEHEERRGRKTKDEGPKVTAESAKECKVAGCRRGVLHTLLQVYVLGADECSVRGTEEYKARCPRLSACVHVLFHTL